MNQIRNYSRFGRETNLPFDSIFLKRIGETANLKRVIVTNNMFSRIVLNLTLVNVFVMFSWKKGQFYQNFEKLEVYRGHFG